jgi:Leucine-rich repeat (LRR) protein
MMAPLRALVVFCLVQLVLPARKSHTLPVTFVWSCYNCCFCRLNALVSAACTRGGANEDCSCSGAPSVTTVICDYTNISTSIPRIPGTATIYSLAHNQISRLTELSFTNEILSTLTRLQRINLRLNDITSIGIGTFDFLSDMRTLDISFNSISVLSEELFRKLSKLTTLRLNNNAISSIAPGAFNQLTSLEELYLDNNNLLSLNENWFKALRKLRV